ARARTSAEEARLAPLAAALERRAAELAAADAGLRAGVAHTAVAHALELLAGEREGIDYGLAASAYARSVKLSAGDPLPVAAHVRGGEPNEPTESDVAAD